MRGIRKRYQKIEQIDNQQTSAIMFISGVGEWLISMLAQLGQVTCMFKLMATVFKHNPGSLDFFRKMGFTTDETNDPQTDYLIMSKTI